jgi:hypothetical protein
VDYSRVFCEDDRWPEEFSRELALALYKQVDFKGGEWSSKDTLLSRLNKNAYFVEVKI